MKDGHVYLTRSQQAVYNAIKKALEDDYQPSYTDLQRMAKCSSPTIAIAIRKLEELGMIEVHRPGPRKRNLYSIPED